MLDSPGCVLRYTGYATPTSDYSGHGASGDGIITFDPLIGGFRSAPGWLANQGLAHQICVGHEFGAAVTLRSCSPTVQAYILVSPALDPLSYGRNFVFSDVQPFDLEHHGVTTMPDDSESMCRQFMISKHILADMSMVSGEDVLRGLSVPVLTTYNSFDEETGLLDCTHEVFHLLLDSSFVKMIATPDDIAGEYTPVDSVPIIDEAVDRALTASGSAHLPTLADVAARWASRWMSMNR